MSTLPHNDNFASASPADGRSTTAAPGPDEQARGCSIGIVVIGRNEGERLKRCLRSVQQSARRIVYVDSGSTDGSREFAHHLDRVDVVDLDLSRPFTMARSRNTGFRRLRELDPGIALVQFVDGDCEVMPGWLERASAFLVEHTDVAVVCGRCRERFPEATIWNRLADMEWQAPAGESRACGGNAMMRAEVFAASGGFREGLIAGEEPELCLRLRRDGWKIWRLPEEMVLHDVAMTRFGQWWRRAVRGGHAYAEAASLHGRGPERYRMREVSSALLWGAAVPLVLAAALVLAVMVHIAFALVLAAGLAGYGLIAWRIVRGRLRVDRDLRGALLYTFFCLLGKPAQVQGIAMFVLRRLRGEGPRLIEYKLAGQGRHAAEGINSTPSASSDAESSTAPPNADADEGKAPVSSASAPAGPPAEPLEGSFGGVGGGGGSRPATQQST